MTPEKLSQPSSEPKRTHMSREMRVGGALSNEVVKANNERNKAQDKLRAAADSGQSQEEAGAEFRKAHMYTMAVETANDALTRNDRNVERALGHLRVATAHLREKIGVFNKQLDEMKDGGQPVVIANLELERNKAEDILAATIEAATIIEARDEKPTLESLADEYASDPDISALFKRAKHYDADKQVAWLHRKLETEQARAERPRAVVLAELMEKLDRIS